MTITATEIRELIQTAIPDAIIQIDDLAGDGDHYAVHVTSVLFATKSRVQQHQMVYQALGTRVGKQLHALSVRTSLPLKPSPLTTIERET